MPMRTRQALTLTERIEIQAGLRAGEFQQLRAYQEMLNECPRKILNWKSPAQCFHELLFIKSTFKLILECAQPFPRG
jgi:hypothetical protein